MCKLLYIGPNNVTSAASNVRIGVGIISALSNMSRNLYKKKGIGGVDPKDKRRLRRSLHQKEVRDHGFLSRRVVDDEFSPLREQPKETAQSKLPVPRTLADETKKNVKSKPAPTGKKADPRREMLAKWKAEKELKRKVDQMKKEKSRPTFKVRKIEYERVTYLPSKKQQQDGPKKIPSSGNKTVAAEKQTMAPSMLRRSSRLASKENPETVHPRKTTQTRTVKPEVKNSNRPVRSTRATSTNKPATSKMVTPAPVKKTTQKLVPKITQPVMPTMSSFTFRKEINLKLTSALPVPKRKPKSAVTGVKTPQPNIPLKKTHTAAEAKKENKPKIAKDVVNKGEEMKKLETVSKEDVDGAKYYQSLMDGERERMTSLCSTWSQVMEEDKVPESVHGDIRSAIGKAQLLMDQRFKQFGGLVEQCRLGQGEKRTHTTDLQGFWEMVGFQIEDVNKMFENLTELQKNDWQLKGEMEQVVKPVVKKQILGKVKKPTGDKNAARERLAAAKAAMKAKKAEVVVFDAGFFKVESPAKEKEPHCAAGSSFQNTPVRRSFTSTASPLLRRSVTRLSNTPKRTSLASSEQGLLRAVLQASHTPKMASLSLSFADSGHLPGADENKLTDENITPSNNSICTRLRDLGLSSGKSSIRKRRRSQRTKSTREDEEVNMEKENDISCYLAPTLSVVDLNTQAEDMMETEPVVQLRDLGKKTPLTNQKEEIPDSTVFPNVTVRKTPGHGMTPRASKTTTPKSSSSLSPEMEPTPSKIPKKRKMNTPFKNAAAKEESKTVQEIGEEQPSETLAAVSREDIEGAAHYQSVMDAEKERLIGLCSSWSQVLENGDVPDDVHGDIRSAIGKAQLLMNQRFKQFGGLVEQCRLGQGEKKTHTTDLQGFWEMVGFQIEDVDKMFAKLSELKDNDWKPKEEEKPVVKKVVKKKAASKVKKPTGDKNAARERLAAAKAAMKAKKAEVVVFDAGFFKVESPAKEKEPHCAAGTSVPNSPFKRRSSQANSLLRKSLTPHSSKRTSLAAKEQDLLRAVLQASHHSPKIDSVPSPDVAGSLFTPEKTPSDDVCTRLRDLGLSSGKSSMRKRRRSQRRKSTKEEAPLEEGVDKENEDDLSCYLMPSVPVVDLNSQAEEMMKTEPSDQLRDLGKRTPLTNKNGMVSDTNVFVKPHMLPFNPSPVGDLFDSPKLAPRRSTRLRAGRVSAFTPPRRSFANVPPSVDLISFD